MPHLAEIERILDDRLVLQTATPTVTNTKLIKYQRVNSKKNQKKKTRKLIKSQIDINMINETQIDPNNDINNWSTCHTMVENKNKQLKYKTRKSADKEKVINEFLQQNIHLPVNELYEKCIKQFPHEKKKKNHGNKGFIEVKIK